MKKNKIGIKEIAAATGLSTSYIRKVSEFTKIEENELWTIWLPLGKKPDHRQDLPHERTIFGFFVRL